MFIQTWDSTFAKNVSWKKCRRTFWKEKKKSLVGRAVQKNNIQNGGKFKARDSRFYLFYIPRRPKTSVLARTAHEMTLLFGGTRLIYASSRQRTDAALESSLQFIQTTVCETQHTRKCTWLIQDVTNIYTHIHKYTDNVVTSVKQYRIQATASFKQFAQLNTIHLCVRTGAATFTAVSPIQEGTVC